MAHNTPSFAGFRPETFAFLCNLEQNNNKPWFEANRDHYQRDLLEPMLDLVEVLSAAMLAIDPAFEVRPAIGKTVSRIYRDVRFSQDKSPYRPRLWLTFKRPNKQWQDAPAYYFGLGTDHARYGMGFYAPSRETMDRFRRRIEADPTGFLQLIAPPQPGRFTVQGEMYQKPRTANLDPRLTTWHQRKTLHLSRQEPVTPTLFQPQLATTLQADFKQLATLYHFFWQLKP
ncbi:MAG: DUF2461 domain-containing protein [Magnetococcales bacterium]|nr:DUF2461 domain-containing protein [Magnetococcales bacterium]